MRLKFISLSIVLIILSACATHVSFQNANLGSGEPTEKIFGLLAKPSGKGPFPAVVLLHTCGGVQPHVSEDWPAFLTRLGYATLTVDTFGSRNAGRCPAAFYLRGFPMWRDAIGALDYLAGRPDIDPDRIGVMGFSLGAMAIESFAWQDLKSPGGRNFAAGIALYGRCQFYLEPSFPLLEIIGDKDKNVFSCPDEIISRVSVDIIPGAAHAFDQRQIQQMQLDTVGNTMLYSASATNLAEKASKVFLDRHLK